jgi:hypothetical protein
MADYTKIDGVASADIAKVSGVSAGDIAKVVGLTNPGEVEEGPPTASRWIVGATGGKLFSTTVSDASSGWAELVDLGSNSYKDCAIGEDNSGNLRWAFQKSGITNEIEYANDSLDLTDINNWSQVDFDPSYKAVDGGPALAWGNNVWIAGGYRIGDGDSYVSLMRSTDGAASWSPVDEGNTVNDNTMAVCYKSGTTWAMGHQSHVWVSTDNGVNWTDKITLEGTKDIEAMAYDGTGRWVAVLTGGNLYTSDDDWDTATERTEAIGGFVLTGVVYAAGTINKWIVTGASGRLQYSSDGVTWTAIWEGDDTTWGTSHIRAIATDNATVVIVGDSGKLATSTNGTSFDMRSIAGDPTPTQGLKCIACNIIGTGMR